MHRKSLRLILVALLVLVLALLMTGCGKKGESAKLGLKPSPAKAAPETSGGSSVSQTSTGDPKAPTALQGSPNTGTNTGGAGTGGSGSGSGGSSSSGSAGSPGGSTTKPSTKPTAKGIAVKVLWWNDTETKSAAECEIVYGKSSFKPVATEDAASGSIGPVPYGTSAQLVIYPDGRSGKKLIVPFTVDTSMVANSDRDAIHVEVSDTRVRVLGNAIDGFDRAFDRF